MPPSCFALVLQMLLVGLAPPERRRDRTSTRWQASRAPPITIEDDAVEVCARALKRRISKEIRPPDCCLD